MFKFKFKFKKESDHEQDKPLFVNQGIESHPAWQGDLTLGESEELLEGKAPFTYIITEGFGQCHYFLTFVDANGAVKHRNVRFVIKNQKPLYFSGGGGQGYESIDHLVCNCLKCGLNVCCPF